MKIQTLQITFKISDSFGSPLIGRTYQAESLNGYRFGFNKQEKDDEIYGKGNASSATFWEYDTRLGRRWNLDPKPNLSISNYACFGNNPLFLIDINGDKFVNPYKEQLTDKTTKKESAQKNLDEFKGNKNSRAYRKLEKSLRKAENDYNITKDKMEIVDNTLKDLQTYNKDLYDRMDKLEDPFRNEVSIFIYIESKLNTRPYSKMGTPDFDSPRPLAGITEAKAYGESMNQIDSKKGTEEDVIKITSDKGPNSMVITLDRNSDKGLTLSHECGHGYYMAKHMYQYLQWMKANPKNVIAGGHGSGDPSGAAADNEEIIYSKNKNGK